MFTVAYGRSKQRMSFWEPFSYKFHVRGVLYFFVKRFDWTEHTACLHIWIFDALQKKQQSGVIITNRTKQDTYKCWTCKHSELHSIIKDKMEIESAISNRFLWIRIGIPIADELNKLQRDEYKQKQNFSAQKKSRWIEQNRNPYNWKLKIYLIESLSCCTWANMTNG